MSSKIDGVPRELLQKVDDVLYIMTGHDSYPRLVHKYGKDWWTPINEMRNGLCTILAAPVVERQPVPQKPFSEMLAEAQELVRSKITWRKFIKSTPLDNDIAVWMVEFARDITAPPELAELQATIARLTAEVERLRSAQSDDPSE
jgi:hypothetical protein